MRTAFWLFLLGLGLRLLFWQAGPDGGAAWHIGFLGDAAIVQEQAGRLAANVPDEEMLLPWRPPAMLWLVAALWDGAGGGWLPRLVCVVIGALTAPLCWLLLRGRVARPVALLAALACALSSNLLLVSSGLHVEGLHLALLFAALGLQAALAERPAPWRAVALALLLGVLHGGLCLLRGEHTFFVPVLLVAGVAAGLRWRWLVLVLFAATAVIAPWQQKAARLVDEFNQSGAPPPRLALPWDEPALAAVAALPAFSRRAVYELVDDTVRHRGGAGVSAADLAIVQEAWGCWPEPVPTPWIALYGALNFFVANAPESERGGTWDAVFRPPPLAGGALRFPAWVAPPPGQQRPFSLRYPPYLAIALHGYARGVAEIRADPLAWLGRVVRKYVYALDGAASGIGGFALPIGLSGERRPVDLVAPRTIGAACWRLLLLALAGYGLFRLRRNRALWPLFAFALLKLALIGLFFGQARHGVLLLPVLALGVAAALEPLLRRWPVLASRRLSWALLGVLVLADGSRALGTGATLDGHPVRGLEPFGPQDLKLRTIGFH